ncbi:MAG: DUF4292 domain-containing protein [Flavobacteriaceae bacterium]|jgi:hypothetical protein
MKYRILVLGLIGWLFIITSSCKSVAVLPTKTPVKNVDVSALSAKIKSSYPKVNRMRSRIRVTYDDGSRQQQIVVQLRLESQKNIWLSASMIVPIAKLLITPEKVFFYEKFQKNSFEGKIEEINKMLELSFTYQDVENLLLGIPFLDPGSGRWKQISNPNQYILLPQGKRNGIQPTLFFDPVTFLLTEQRVLIPGTNRNLSIRYLNHTRIEGETLPQKVEITILDGDQIQKLELEFTRIDFPDTLTFPFEIPEGYKTLEF